MGVFGEVRAFYGCIWFGIRRHVCRTVVTRLLAYIMARVNIAVKELYPIVLALILRSNVLADKRLLVLCDDEAVVHVINNQTCKEQYIISLIRTMTVIIMRNKVILRAKHVPGKKNIIADALSRFQDTPEIRDQYGLVQLQSVIPPDLLPWPL